MDNSNQNISLLPGEYMIREKTACDALYIIKEGQLEVFRTTSSGEKIPLGMISSGQYVGETALLTGKMHSSNVVALSNVKAIRLPKESIEAQLKQAPTWLVGMTKGLIARLQATNEIMRKNGWVDETLMNSLRAVEDKFKKVP